MIRFFFLKNNSLTLKLCENIKSLFYSILDFNMYKCISYSKRSCLNHIEIRISSNLVLFIRIKQKRKLFTSYVLKINKELKSYKIILHSQRIHRIRPFS